MSDIYEEIPGMPAEVATGLHRLGSNIRIARLKRRLKASELARRMEVSLPTLRKLERGDSTVSLGTLAKALWVLDAMKIEDIAAPSSDEIGMWEDIKRLPSRVRATKLADARRSLPDDDF